MRVLYWLGGERNILYKGVETFPEQTRFKALRRILKGKSQRGQYLLVVGLDCYTHIDVNLNCGCWLNGVDYIFSPLPYTISRVCPDSRLISISVYIE